MLVLEIDFYLLTYCGLWLCVVLRVDNKPPPPPSKSTTLMMSSAKSNKCHSTQLT